MPAVTCVYNLFPTLAGEISRWPEHLPRIRRMAFDWIYLNPFHYPGFSGSLYAVKDFGELHPVVRGASERPADALVRDFATAAAADGVRVMMDLVLNHTSKDALLTAEHPDWYVREPDGALRSPRAVDPVDPRKTTVWGDLAEIDYSRPALRSAQVEHWARYVLRHAALGIGGFRCDAAYQVPADFWQELIGRVRSEAPDTVFAAETLGCTPDEAAALSRAGFDLLFNSAKWWDFKAPWLLDQYELYRRIAPTIAFPESHDTDRLAHELQGSSPEEIEAAYKLRYLFAASFSSAVMMPMGYEFGFSKRLHVVQTRPGDWDWEARARRLDLVDFVATVNRAKAATPALRTEGLQIRVTAPHAPVVGLARFDRADSRIATDATLLVINPDPAREHGCEVGPLVAAMGGRFGSFDETTPGSAGGAFAPGDVLTLRPMEARLLHARAAEAPAEPATDAPARAEERLHALAADRIAIEKVTPEIDGGRFPVKRVVGDALTVEADIFGDGHERIAASVRYREADRPTWREAPMVHVDNDRWRARLPLTRNARYEYVVQAWRDLFASWREEVSKKRDAGVGVALELIEGRH
ncbi:MAG: maltotransferase domain-containing protein, partial [Alphaproteobacteria bacterium]